MPQITPAARYGAPDPAPLRAAPTPARRAHGWQSRVVVSLPLRIVGAILDVLLVLGLALLGWWLGSRFSLTAEILTAALLAVPTAFVLLWLMATRGRALGGYACGLRSLDARTGYPPRGLAGMLGLAGVLVGRTRGVTDPLAGPPAQSVATAVVPSRAQAETPPLQPTPVAPGAWLPRPAGAPAAGVPNGAPNAPVTPAGPAAPIAAAAPPVVAGHGELPAPPLLSATPPREALTAQPGTPASGATAARASMPEDAPTPAQPDGEPPHVVPFAPTPRGTE